MSAPKSWSEEAVIGWLHREGFGRWENAFRENGVDGRMLLDLTKDEMQEDLGIDNANVVARILAVVGTLRETQRTQTRARKRRKVQILNPAQREWTLQEIDSLTNFHALYGDRIDKYSHHFPGKSTSDLWEKVMEVVQPGRQKASVISKNSTGLFWTAEEDSRLLSLWPIYKKQWNKYVNEFQGRSKVAIRQHLKILIEKQEQINLGTMISVFVNGIWKNGMVTKMYEGENSGLVNLSSEDNVEMVNLDEVKYKVVSQPPNRRRRRGNRREPESGSLYKGVRFDDLQKKWIATVCHKKQLIHCGSYATEREAAIAYDTKALKEIGKRATLNFPELAEDQVQDGFAHAPEENPYLGVTWDKHARKWKVHVHHDKKVHHCGYFNILLKAAHMYDQKCIEFKGHDAKKLNFPANEKINFEKPASMQKSKRSAKAFLFSQDPADIIPQYFVLPGEDKLL